MPSENANVVETDAVQLTFEEGVATVTLDEPERKNALSREIAAGIIDALDAIESQGARCVVFEGTGGAFSAGGDIDLMAERLDADEPIDDRVLELQRSTSRTIVRVATFPLPTIAKIDGPAVGAGANLAIACDVQIASDRASVGFVFRNVGLSVDAGTSYLLPRIVGENVAKELVFTGEILDADRSLELGLLNHVWPADEFEDRANEFVAQVASGPTVALRHAKRLIDGAFDTSIERAVADEATAQGIVFETDDHEEGVRAFLDRREPEFEGQ